MGIIRWWSPLPPLSYTCLPRTYALLAKAQGKAQLFFFLQKYKGRLNFFAKRLADNALFLQEKCRFLNFACFSLLNGFLSRITTINSWVNVFIKIWSQIVAQESENMVGVRHPLARTDVSWGRCIRKCWSLHVHNVTLPLKVGYSTENSS